MRKGKQIHRFIAFLLSMTLTVPAFTSMAFAAAPVDSSFQLYMIPNTHLDTAWQWPFQHTADNYLRNMYTNQINRLEENDDYRFTTSASQHYQWIKEYYNDDNPIEGQRLWGRLKELVANGQWDITGGQVIEPDLNIPSGESLVRQGLYAQHFFEEEFGKENVPKTGMVPDVFGFSGQLPQILRKSEMPYFVTSKINWNETTGQGGTSDDFRSRSDANRGRDSDLLNWRALDGESSVLSYLLYNDYNNTNLDSDGDGTVEDGEVARIFDQNWQTGLETGVKKAMAFYGGGDMGQGLAGGGGDNYGYVAAVDANTTADVKMSTATDYFEDVVTEEDLDAVRTYEGEMYLEYHRGTYTTWARAKKYNRDNEILAESAEKAATLGFYTGSVPTNSEERIAQGWNKVLVNQMHDVLPGSALAYQYYVTFNDQEMAANLFNGVRDNALAALAYRADTEVEGKPVFVYNELSWQRDGEVTVDLRYDAMPEAVVLYDGETPIIPAQSVWDGERGVLAVTFTAKDVPAVGYKVFDARVEEQADGASPLFADEANWTFGNDRLRFRLNPATGYIASLEYNEGGAWQEAFAQGVGTEGAELHVYKDTEVRPPQNFDVWELNRSEIDKAPDWIVDGAPKSMAVTVNTSEKITVRVIKEWNGSEIAQDMTLYADSDRLDVRLSAEWYQQKRMLKVSFPILADTDTATYETSYGAVERPTDRLNAFEYARYEVPGHKWLDVTDASGDFGVSILNDAKYGFDSLRRTLGGTTFVRSRITAVRTPRAQAWAPSGASGGHSSGAVGSPWTPYQPYVVDSGHHEFNYAIYPHSGGWQTAGTVNEAHELNYPMTAFETAENNGGLGAAHSFAASDKPNVIISALKNQYDSPEDKNKVIVRVYESGGIDTQNVTLTLPGAIVSAKEVNLLEHDYEGDKALTLAGDKLSFDIGKFEILTIEAQLAPTDLAALTVPQTALSVPLNQQATSSKTTRETIFIDGGGTAEDPGLSMPEIGWPEKGLEYQGIYFAMGRKDAPNVASGLDEPVHVIGGVGFDKLYVLGFAVGGEAVEADFTVNYADGTSDTKTIRVSDWRTDLSGWDREAWIDNRPYVYDTIAHANTHYHRTHGTTGGGSGYTAIMMTVDNYLFVYDMAINPDKEVKSVTLPTDEAVKVAALTLANPVPGYGKVYDASQEPAWSFEAPAPTAPQTVRATYVPGTTPAYKDFSVTWDQADNAVKYRLYVGSSPDFVPSAANQLTEQGGLTYTHSSPSILGTDAMAGLTQLYYKVVAVGKAGDVSAASAASNGIAPQYVDYALRNGRVSANGRTNSGESWELAVDGSLSTKWCVTGISTTNPAWWRIDLTGEDGATVPLDRFVLSHAGMGGEQTSANTRDYTIEYSADSTDGSNGTWETVVEMTDNAASETTHDLSTAVAARWVRLWITRPEYTAWTNAVRLYGFNIIGTNEDFEEPEAVSTATDAKISLLSLTDDEARLGIDYTYYNAANDATPGAKTEGATQFKWYRKFSDVYGDAYTLISGASEKELAVSVADMRNTTAYRCDVTVVDSDGATGATVTVEFEPGQSTAREAAIRMTPSLSGDAVRFAADYTYYNALNDSAPGTKTEGATRFQWYRTTAAVAEPMMILGETARTLTQTTAAVDGATAYYCDITVYDSDGTAGETVRVSLATYKNVLLGATVTEETSSNATAKNMTDGDYATKWDVVTTQTPPGPAPHWAVLDMGVLQPVDQVLVLHANSHPSQEYDANEFIATYDFDVAYSADGENWTTETVRANREPVTTLVLDETIWARYIKITVLTPNAGHLPEANGFDAQYNAIRILEVEALSGITNSVAPAVLYEAGNDLPLSLEAAAGTTADVRVEGFADADETIGSVLVTAAVYDEAGVLLALTETVADVGADGTLACALSDFAVPADADSMRVFFWDDRFIPVCDAVAVQ